MPVELLSLPTEEEPFVRNPDERRGDFKRADLYKMHAYRAAIKGAISVWILYPGTEFRWFGVDGDRSETPDLILTSDLDGVGEIPIQPNDHRTTDLTAVLKRLLS